MTTVQERPAAAAPSRLRLRRPTSRVRAPRTPRPVPARVAAWALAALSALTVWFVLYSLFISALQESHSQSVLYAQLREELSGLSTKVAPLGRAPIEPGSPVAVLDVPAAGLHDVVIVEGTASGDLMKGPGHRRDTVLPGQVGTSVVYGRATMFGGPFKHLAAVHPGDQLTVITGQGTARYVVEDVRRAGDPYPPVLGAGEARLTLVTADGSGWRAGWAPNGAVYVDAKLKGTPYPATSGGRPAAVPKSENALHGDQGALYLLVLWLPLLVAAALGAVWARERWGRWQAWLVGLPVVLAALWGVSQTAVQMLPNLT